MVNGGSCTELKRVAKESTRPTGTKMDNPKACELVSFILHDNVKIGGIGVNAFAW